MHDMPHTEKAKLKMSLAKKGKHYSPATEFKKGQVGYWLGKKRSSETIKKMIKNHKGFTGRHHTKENREKIAERLSKTNHGKHNSPETEFKKGKDSPNWKGGISTLYNQIRALSKFKKWRLDAFKRDNFTCRNCRETKKSELQCHHLEGYAKIIMKYKIKTLQDAFNCKNLWDINNGITICKNCHKKTNNYSIPVEERYEKA